MSSVPARPSTHHKTSRRGLLSLGESGGGFSIRGGNGSASSATLPASGLPPRPSTRGDGSTPLRRPGPMGFTGTGAAQGSGSSGAAQQQQQQQHAGPAGGSSQLPRVSTPGRAGGGRPPMWGHGGSQSAPTTPLQPRAAAAVGPSGVPRPATHQQGRHRRTHSSDASGPSAAAATAAAAAMKRPSSQQASRSTRSASTPNRPGSMGGQDFHRGLVSALQDVLRQQRQGVFPTVTSDGIEMSRGASRPGTSAGSEQPTGAASSGAGGVGSPTGPRTTSTPLGGPGGRWGFTPTQEADDEDPFPTRPSASQSRGRRAAPAAPATGPPGAPWVEEAEDVLLSAAALQMLRNVERSEGIERRNLNALADSDWDALMARETSEVVEAAHRPTAGRASSNSRPPSSSAVRPGTGANRAMPGARVASASLSGHPRKAGGAQLRVKRHSSGNVSLDTSAESMQSNPADGGGDAAALKAQGNEHYAQRRFLAAHRSYSLAMESDPANAVLLSNRAATHTMLLNYDACVRDCLRATSLDPKNWKAYSRMARAHAMLGQYPVAARHFTTALVLLEDSQRNGGPSSSAAAQAEVVKTERGELQHLERARLECDAANTQAAAGHYTKAASFVDEAPIRLLRLGCVLQFSPASARAELTKYLSTLDHPSTYATSDAASAVPSSGEGSAQSEALPLPPSSLMLLVPKLLLSKAQHYCAVLVTLAKASLYCGVHYLNIAASHLQQCIAIRADFPGAQAMLTQLTTFEDRLAAATELADAESHADAVTAFTEALDATHDTNTKVRGLVLVQRAESYLKVSMPKPAIEDCTVALSYDGNNVKALTKRARAHEALGDFRAALLDLEHAATINEELAEVVVALRMRMQQHQHQHQQQQQQQPSGSGGYFGGSRPGTGTGGRPGTGASYGQRPGTSQQSARPVATHYATLGVCAEADSGTIRTAYRKLTLQLHPDKLVKEADEVRQRCELRFKEVSHAYSVLSDPVQRMQYDLSLP